MVDLMGRAWKVVILIAAALATCSFFLPFYTARLITPSGEIGVPVPAYRIVLGFTDLAQVDPGLRAPPADAARLVAKFNDSLQEWSDDLSVPPRRSRIPAYYLAALALLVIGGFASSQRQLGMFGALLALAAGLWLLAASRAQPELARWLTHAKELPPHSGAALLLGVAGLLALLAGVGGLVWADPGGFRVRHTISTFGARGDAPIAVEMPSRERNAEIPTATLKPPRGKLRSS